MIDCFDELPQKVAKDLGYKMHNEIDLRIFKELQKHEFFSKYLLIYFDISISQKQDLQSKVELIDKEKGTVQYLMQIPIGLNIRKRKFWERQMVRTKLFIESIELYFRDREKKSEKVNKTNAKK